LLGPTSSFQDSVRRAEAIAGARPPVIVAGIGHLAFIQGQLAEIGASAVILLEPEPRDSSAAVAAAVAWIEREHPEAVAVLMSADHHLPDDAAFAAAVAKTLPWAERGSIVTLGIAPAVPAVSYGYIQPGEGDEAVRPVAAFVEKPDAARARDYVQRGFLWNSGYFVARASTLAGELQHFAPEVLAAARSAVAEGACQGGATVLGESFRTAPKISIDYAVMERTDRAAVLPVDFEWSDLGAWDAIWAAAAKDDQGNVLPPNSQAVEAHDNLVVAPQGVHVAVLGTRGVGVIVERDAVLVCDLSQSQLVRTVAGAAPPAPPEQAGFCGLADAARWYDLWLRTAALPLWATAGVDARTSAFRDRLGADGRPDELIRRARVQARQVFVYASAAKAGMDGPWAETARRGFDAYLQGFRRPDGLFVHSTELDGTVRDRTAYIYEQAFSTLAVAALKAAGAGSAELDASAACILAGLQGYRHAAGGFRELDDHPWQANATMHLFEAALAWDALEPGGAWGALADELAALALERFIDPEGGFLREFFDEAWRPAAGDDGRWVEPGHQFEWAWLLTRWGRTRRREDALTAARNLYEIGKRGVDRVRNVAVDVLWDDLTVRDSTARLWPQTERLKAALLFEDEAEALAAANGLFRYLDVPVRGLWRDRLKGEGTWVEEPAPASSFYHIVGAILPLLDRSGLLSAG
jgi:mannose/cellobiose epimerase-like protein (N-acyl-D-glucosamine 2-epimerase family)/mannose-1-phosphate guanylyltransferase